MAASSRSSAGDPGVARLVPAVGGGVLGHQDEFFDPGGGQIFGLLPPGCRGGGCASGPRICGMTTEGAAVAAAFGDLQIGQMAGRGGVAGLDAGIGVGRGLMNQQAAPPPSRGPVQELDQGGKIVHPDEQIDFREVLRSAPGHSAAPGSRPPPGVCRAGLLVAGQLQDGVHRLLAGRLDEAAGVDQEEIGGRRAYPVTSQPAWVRPPSMISVSTRFLGQPRETV